uniref:Membrane protein BRI3 n=1 Tax=Parascaris univalens TaxID=6257 RepID=A0A914ZTF0_PARUN
EKEMDRGKSDPPPPYEQNIVMPSAPLPSSSAVIYVEQHPISSPYIQLANPYQQIRAYVPYRYDQPNVIVVSIPRCPKCQSANLDYDYPCGTLSALILLAIIFFPIGLLYLLLLKKERFCRDCHTEF